jgi:LmbE family N-acetylglucosaminyl deacetylase
MNERVLVIAAHPDDEVLGCGGTIARHADAGDSVDILLVADGVSARPDAPQTASERRDCARLAAKTLGAREPGFLDVPDNRLDGVELLDLVQAIERLISRLEPELVYTHHGGDLNIDHRVVHQAVVTALRPLPGRRCKGILAFEVLSSTEWASDAIGHGFRPNHFVDVSATIERKMDALRCYQAEMRPFPHSRSCEAVRALATLRGASAGLVAAEAFSIVRWIER